MLDFRKKHIPSLKLNLYNSSLVFTAENYSIHLITKWHSAHECVPCSMKKPHLHTCGLLFWLGSSADKVVNITAKQTANDIFTDSSAGFTHTMYGFFCWRQNVAGLIWLLNDHLLLVNKIFFIMKIEIPTAHRATNTSYIYTIIQQLYDDCDGPLSPTVAFLVSWIVTHVS